MLHIFLHVEQTKQSIIAYSQRYFLLGGTISDSVCICADEVENESQDNVHKPWWEISQVFLDYQSLEVNYAK